MLDLDFAQASDCGRVRGHNEDYLGYVLPEVPRQEQTHGWLFALADGVGGQQQGEVASRTAVETLLAGFRRAAGGEQLRLLLPRLVQAANEKVFETGLAGKSGGLAIPHAGRNSIRRPGPWGQMLISFAGPASGLI